MAYRVIQGDGDSPPSLQFDEVMDFVDYVDSLGDQASAGGRRKADEIRRNPDQWELDDNPWAQPTKKLNWAGRNPALAALALVGAAGTGAWALPAFGGGGAGAAGAAGSAGASAGVPTALTAGTVPVSAGLLPPATAAGGSMSIPWGTVLEYGLPAAGEFANSLFTSGQTARDNRENREFIRGENERNREVDRERIAQLEGRDRRNIALEESKLDPWRNTRSQVDTAALMDRRANSTYTPARLNRGPGGTLTRSGGNQYQKSPELMAAAKAAAAMILSGGGQAPSMLDEANYGQTGVRDLTRTGPGGRPMPVSVGSGRSEVASRTMPEPVGQSHSRMLAPGGTGQDAFSAPTPRPPGVMAPGVMPPGFDPWQEMSPEQHAAFATRQPRRGRAAPVARAF